MHERIADYELVRELGQGNHGHFYLARRPDRLAVDAEFVALKIIITGGTSDVTFQRATRELKAFASVSSPYIVRLYDAGQTRSSFFYVMEYLELGSLATPVRPLTVDEKLRAVQHAALAAHALHEAGLVHRDIKPGNVLLHEDGAKLSDLGLAQVLAPGLTVTGMGAIESIQYIDPDLVRGARASRASDIWSLGVTLHQALTGAELYPPLPKGDPLLAVRMVLKAQPVLDPGLTPGERDIVDSCVHPALERRLPTAAALAERIGQLRGQLTA